MAVRFLQEDQVARVIDRLNSDPEFERAALFLSTDILLEVDDDKCFIKVRDGKVTHIFLRKRPAWADRSDVFVRAPVQAWEKFLLPVPPPFYHEFLAATAHHEFEVGGDLNTLFGYLWAFDRMFAVLRELQNE